MVGRAGRRFARAALVATTDAQGYFELRGLARGSYELLLHREGEAELHRDLLNVSDDTAPLRLQLPDGSPRSGIVTHPSGALPPDVRVALIGSRTFASSSDLDVLQLWGSTPDEEGRFRFERTAAGQYLLAGAPGHEPVLLELDGGEDPVRIQLQPEPQDALPPPSASPFAELPAGGRGRLLVSVFDAAGSPVSIGSVRALRSAGEKPYRAPLASSGVAVFDGLPEGDYELALLAPGHGPWQELDEREWVRVEASGDTSVELRMARAFLATVGVHDQGRPLSAAAVVLAELGRDEQLACRLVSPEAAQRTNGLGQASVLVPYAGAFQLAARAAPNEAVTVREAHLRPGASARIELGRGRCDGQVNDANGLPLQATLRLWQRRPDGHPNVVIVVVANVAWAGPNKLRLGEAVTVSDADGQFRWLRLPEGHYALEAHAHGYWELPRGLLARRGWTALSSTS